MSVQPDRRFLRRLIFVASLALASCGDGGLNVAGVDSGGTGSYAVGTITGFGSIVVNDIRYDDSAARVVNRDGTPGTAADLRLGMVVQIEGSTLTQARPSSPYGREGTASQITYGAEIIGPLQGVDATAGQLIVLGQKIAVSTATLYGDELAGGLPAIARLPSGSTLEIYGFLEPGIDGLYTATRVDLRPGAQDYILHGIVRKLDPINRRFRIGSAQIDYLALGTDEARQAGVVEDGLARVRLGTVARTDGTWPMLAAAPEAPRVPEQNIIEIDIEGPVTTFTSAAAFAIDRIPVDASAAVFEYNGGQLGVGRRVGVSGRLRDGVLIADRVEVRREESERVDSGQAGQGTQQIFLSGPIGALDLVGGRFKLRGVTVNLLTASFAGGSLADLRNGVTIDVVGRRSADGATINALEIRFGVARATPAEVNQPQDNGKPANPGKPDKPDKPDKPEDNGNGNGNHSG